MIGGRFEGVELSFCRYRDGSPIWQLLDVEEGKLEKTDVRSRD